MKDVIFISYRRRDSQSVAARLNHDLSKAYGRHTIFVDREDIPPGADFRQVLGSRIMRCKVVLVVINNQYVTLKGQDGVPRIMGDNDFVNIEVSTALTFKDRKLIIPILVDGTPMPKSSELPENMQSLLFLNAFPLDSMRWDMDIERLKKAIIDYLREDKRKSMPVAAQPKTRPQTQRQTSTSTTKKKKSSLPTILGIGAAIVGLFIIGLVGSVMNNSGEDEWNIKNDPQGLFTVHNFEGIITSDELNLRDNPGTENTNVIGVMKEGELIEVTGAKMLDDKKWYAVNYNGVRGWASSTFIEEYNHESVQPKPRPSTPSYTELIDGTWQLTEAYRNGQSTSLQEYFGLTVYDPRPIALYVVNKNTSLIELYVNGNLDSTNPFSIQGNIMSYYGSTFQILTLNSNSMTLKTNMTDLYGNSFEETVVLVRQRY